MLPNEIVVTDPAHPGGQTNIGAYIKIEKGDVSAYNETPGENPHPIAYGAIITHDETIYMGTVTDDGATDGLWEVEWTGSQMEVGCCQKIRVEEDIPGSDVKEWPIHILVDIDDTNCNNPPCASAFAALPTLKGVAPRILIPVEGSKVLRRFYALIQLADQYMPAMGIGFPMKKEGEKFVRDMNYPPIIMDEIPHVFSYGILTFRIPEGVQYIDIRIRSIKYLSVVYQTATPYEVI